ncbi:T9SS type A sorting domain-containing protein [Rhodocaloribacter litoris]|uniref:T9SS type A sorting domain-containing protein n=1 Tax=Rhodocaloribacter litoris TaxID=2558931 RepID=UPI0014247E88|nr:T9SS type A sorting domain-containing protein [Rhodocaloribacter litoris]QXD14464.1 T9SS type A sorting domain-containing protein [Rhodocaloribacter litoris]
MRIVLTIATALWLLSPGLANRAQAQQAGDYRAVANGTWSAAATWETFDGTNWVAAATAPTGSETITIAGDDTVRVDAAVTVTGYVRVAEEGVLLVDGGSLQFADGSTYEHARDGGDLPSAEWAAGSTYLLTGTEQDAPGNRNQNFHHLTINTPALGRNRDLGLNGVTIGGDIRVISTGSNRWQLTSASAGDSSVVTILGDVYVEDGQFAVQGTGNALTTFIVHHYGNIVVTGGNFSAARGSQGSGSGTTTWYLYGGNFTLSNAATQNSNPTPGNARFVFAANGTQQLAFENVDYAGGQVHFEVADSTMLEIGDGFALNGWLINRGEVTPLGTLTVMDGAVYEHARNGGTVPSATWMEGSTALFTGITTDAPENRGQDYHHLTLDTPDLASNRDLGLDGHTIGGNLSVLSSGSARWRLVGGSSGTVVIKGDLIVRDASFETQGTSSPTDVVVEHYGNVDVDGGEFSISRGSQGSGTGTTLWYLYGGNFTMANARTRNSNPTPGNARFIFAGGGTQHLTLGADNQIDDLSVEVSDSTTLDVGTSEIGGAGVFILQSGATLATAHPDGVAGSIQTSGPVTLPDDARFEFNGTEAQVTSTAMPAVVQDLVIDNAAGVTLSQETTINGVLVLRAGVFDNTIPFTLGSGASISFEGGSLLIPVASEEEADLPSEFALYPNYPNPFSTSTLIRFDLKEAAHVTLTVYDVTGREVAELMNDQRGPGRYQVEWNAAGLSSGVYFYRIRAGSWQETRSLLLAR